MSLSTRKEIDQSAEHTQLGADSLDSKLSQVFFSKGLSVTTN
jgi:hypothetical protein